MVKNPPEMQETLVRSRGQEEPWRRDRLPTPVFLCFSCGSAGKESACNARDLGSIPGWGRSPREEGKSYPLQYSSLENSMDLYSPWGCKESDTTQRLSLSKYTIKVMHLNHPQTIPPIPSPPSVKKPSSTKLVSGPEKVGDH